MTPKKIASKNKILTASSASIASKSNSVKSVHQNDVEEALVSINSELNIRFKGTNEVFQKAKAIDFQKGLVTYFPNSKWNADTTFLP